MIKNMEVINKKNINWISISRMVGIVLVVLGHSITGANADMNKFWEIVLLLINSFHMPLFFVVSGFLFYKGKYCRTYGGFIRNKFLDLMLPYFFLSAIYVVLGEVTGDDIYTFENLRRCIYNPMSHFWFLYTLFFVTVISFTLIEVLNVNVKVMLIVNVILLIVINIFRINLWQYEFPIYKILYYNIFFCFGCILKQIDYNGMINKRQLVCLIAIYFICLLIIYLKKSNVAINIVCAMVGTLILFSFSSKFNNKIFIYIGNNTMPIYLIHSLFLNFTRKMFYIIENNKSVIVILTTVLGLIVPLFICKIFSKSKIYNFLFYPRRLLTKKEENINE